MGAEEVEDGVWEWRMPAQRRGPDPPRHHNKQMTETRDEEAMCDLSTVCPLCGQEMNPETSHYRCLSCGYRDSCCF